MSNSFRYLMSSLENMSAEEEICFYEYILHEVFCNIGERDVLCVWKRAVCNTTLMQSNLMLTFISEYGNITSLELPQMT